MVKNAFTEDASDAGGRSRVLAGHQGEEEEATKPAGNE
jgi:hypothetical protein